VDDYLDVGVSSSKNFDSFYRDGTIRIFIGKKPFATTQFGVCPKIEIRRSKPLSTKLESWIQGLHSTTEPTDAIPANLHGSESLEMQYQSLRAMTLHPRINDYQRSDGNQTNGVYLTPIANVKNVEFKIYSLEKNRLYEANYQHDQSSMLKGENLRPILQKLKTAFDDAF
jgi:hypothetical protein